MRGMFALSETAIQNLVQMLRNWDALASCYFYL
jgi:hypothetical protein